MKIIGFTTYKDGGTVRIITQEESYYIDSRLRTKTKGTIYIGYPKDDNSIIADNQEKLKKEILLGVEEYVEHYKDDMFFDYSPAIKELFGV